MGLKDFILNRNRRSTREHPAVVPADWEVDATPVLSRTRGRAGSSLQAAEQDMHKLVTFT